MSVKPSWNLPENLTTPEDIFFNRRKVLQIGTTMFLGSAFTGFLPRKLLANTNYPATLNPEFKLPASITGLTKQDLVTSYNNFYEFSLEKKEVKPLAEKWKIPSPWKVEVSGLTDEAKTYDLEQLIQLAGTLEERIYRFRCVEAWSMVVPWTGFALGKLLPKLKPKKTAKFVKFVSYANEKEFPNIKKQPSYPWPYTEGLRIDEALHPLTFFATGLYGKPLLGQNGAPLRLVVPWKYGFKSIKSIAKIEFTAEQPNTLWNLQAPSEYGFYANVNPEVEHPRWSQASERILDGKLFPTRIKTLKFNGYEKEVAGLYKDLDLKKFY